MQNSNRFIKNKYFQWYEKIVAKAISEHRQYNPSLHEMHHVLPKSFGGDESLLNYIPLTFREHYICHLLLTRFTKGKDKHKMCFALHVFFHFDNHRKLNLPRGRIYEANKQLFIEACKEREAWVKPEIFKFKHIDTNEEFVGTRSEFRKYSGLTSQEIYNLLAPNSKMFYAKRWGVWKEDLGIFSFEKERYIPKIDKKECIHCGKHVTLGNYARWHGEKCKQLL